MKFKFFVILVLILGFLLRIFKLDKFPATLYGDEQAFSWNAYNILKTGRDEYGNHYPLQFRSFDDYKAPVPVYILVPFFKFFGFNTFTIRLPIVLASTLTLPALFFLARIFFNRKISLLITFLLAVSPWHIHLSRGFFESTLALLWFVLGIYFFLISRNRLKIIFLSMIFFSLSIYSYFVPRILVPIFLLFLIWYIFRRGPTSPEVGPSKGKIYFFGLLFLIFLSLPLIYATIFDKGLSRFNKLSESTNAIVAETVRQERIGTNVVTPWKNLLHNKFTVRLRLIKNNYLDHLSANFWYIYGDNSLRYFTGNMGMFYLIELPFFITGLYCLWRDKRAVAVFSLGWILLSPIPASLVGRPFAVRSLSMLPAPFIIAGFGLYKVLTIIKNIRVKILMISIITAGFIFSSGSLLIRYYLEYPVYAATWWGWENKAALDYAKINEDKYENIFISNFYSGVTLAFAVYNQYDPVQYKYAIEHPVTLADGRHLVNFGKYYFGSLDIDKNRLSQNIIPPRTLYIGRPEEADSEETINAPEDGRIIFKIYRTE